MKLKIECDIISLKHSNIVSVAWTKRHKKLGLSQCLTFFILKNKKKFNTQTAFKNQFKSPRIPLKMILDILAIKSMAQ